MARRRQSPRTDFVTLLRRHHAPWWVIALVVISLVAIQFFGNREATPPSGGQIYVVKRVVDGDTLELADGTRVRLLGVDTPETVHPTKPVEPFGPEASRYTKQRVEGKTVTLEFDKERQDRYGRTLAYVTIDGALLNEELIRQGLGRAQLQYPYSNLMKRRFRAAEDEAKEARRGIWSLPTADEAPKRRAA